MQILLTVAADHPFATGFGNTAVLVLIGLLFTGTFVWIWWRSRDFEPELEEIEEDD